MIPCDVSSLLVAEKRTAQPEPLNDVKTFITTILAAPKTVVIPNDESVVRSMLLDLAQYARGLEVQLVEKSRSSASPPPPPSKSSPFSVSSEDAEDLDQESLSQRVKSISLDGTMFYSRHVGKSSHFMLLQTALDIRDEIDGGANVTSSVRRRPEFWTNEPFHCFRRSPEELPYDFPEDALIRKLVDVYFSSFHNVYPLLHRPSFEHQVYVEQLHRKNQRFGAVLLAVCSLGARLSEDPKTFSEGSQNPRSAGWKYIGQIRLFKTNYMDPSSIYDVQVYALALTFLFPTPVADVGWLLSSLGVRCAQEFGAHRKIQSINSNLSRLERQLWNRAFWNIMTTDLYMCIALGRPRALREDDFDCDLPPECDDAYWDTPSHPELEFTQPVGKVSHMAYWHHFMKLLRIAGLIKDHLFTTRKAAPWQDNSPEANDKIVIELESALNSWKDELPDSLKWDPLREDKVLFLQTVMMHSNYYWIQIQLHKQFVRPGSGNFPSLAICANAARAYVHMLQTYLSSPGMYLLPQFIAPTFVAAVMLLINLWTSLRDRTSYDPRKDMADVYSCLHQLSMYETKYESAGRLSDILEEVISFSQMPPLPQKQSLKRSREGHLAYASESMQTDAARPFAGTQRVSNSLHSTFPSADGLSQPAGDRTMLQPLVPAAGPSFEPFFGVTYGTQNRQQQQLSPSLEAQPQFVTQSQLLDYGLSPSSMGGADVSSYSTGMDDPTFAASAWNNPCHEDWTSFMSKVDELLDFVNTDCL
ncbi:hypothetical protein D9757_003137 [Collybiopsis confluens]|uniref:Xylanolytic transcriptional activator regulatory domain-containing protein n=1 Tax=Collybiopsis confluens TaxID=2823264 RepID=A0A8H5ME44_9AGAR|nr:hypothetical protein D9757_003137 [Collybiopsis confluens]